MYSLTKLSGGHSPIRFLGSCIIFKIVFISDLGKVCVNSNITVLRVLRNGTVLEIYRMYDGLPTERGFSATYKL